MQVILGIIVFGLIAIAVIVILVINFMYRKKNAILLVRIISRVVVNPVSRVAAALVAIIARPMALLNRKPLVEQLQAVV